MSPEQRKLGRIADRQVEPRAVQLLLGRKKSSFCDSSRDKLLFIQLHDEMETETQAFVAPASAKRPAIAIVRSISL